jgi:hypothetical protein
MTGRTALPTQAANAIPAYENVPTQQRIPKQILGL